MTATNTATTATENTPVWGFVSSTEGEVSARPHTLSGETKTITHPLTGEPVLLHRLVALVGYPEELGFGALKAGDKGGWVQSLDNLGWDCWVADEACLFDDARIHHAVLLQDQAQVYGQAELGWGVTVSDTAQVYEQASVSGNSHIKDDSCVRGKVHLNPAYLEVSNGTILEGSFTAEEQEQAGLGLEDGELTFDDGKVYSDLLAEFTQAPEAVAGEGSQMENAPKKWQVELEVRANISLTIQAKSKEEALEMIDEHLAELSGIEVVDTLGMSVRPR